MSDPPTAGLPNAVMPPRTHLRLIGAVLLAELVALTMIVVSQPGSALAQTAGDLSQLAAVLLAVAGCVAAARRGGPERRAWAVLASALGVWAAAITLWTSYGLTRNHSYPFPSPADLGFVGYSVPAVVALMLFPRSSSGRASRLHELLDAAVIAGSVLFVSWVTVLGPLYQSDSTGLTRLVGLAYPVVDIAVSSVVLVLGMRVPPEQRRPWLLLGAGLVLLTVTDSVFVSMTLNGGTHLTGTPLVLGWVVAMTLIAAASQIRPGRARPAVFRHFTFLQEMLPTIPVVGAIAVACVRRLDFGDVFLIGNAVVLLVLFAAQQVVAVIERVRLANGLEETILRRTAELSSVDARFRSMVESSDDAIIGASNDGFVTSWNAAAERLLGYSCEEILGKHVSLLFPQDLRDQPVEIRRRVLIEGSVRHFFESERLHKDGRRVPVAVTVSPIFEGDTIKGICAIMRDVTDLLAMQHEMEHRALHDELTGLPNRVLMSDQLEEALAGAERSGSRVGLLLLDLERFKEVNDTFGHHYGDELLRQIGPRLAGLLRGGDTLARVGGDEFAVLLRDVDRVDDATDVATTILAALAIPFQVEDVDLDVEASIGVVISGEHGRDAITLMQHADVAMYVAKAQHLGTFAYDPTVDAHSAAKLAMVGDLRRALQHDELVLHYQPKVNISTGELVGAEALMRWQHPEHGLVLPDDFVPVVEHTGLINPLTRYVLDTALAQARTWIDAGRLLPIAVNLSARNLHDDHFADQVAKLLAAHDVPAQLLELEVTESAIMIDPVRARQMLEQLSALGARISVDDFGAGYTSLSQLTTLPVSELKIDRSFVTTMTQDAGNAIIVQSVIDLGHNLGLTVVAEGVETEQDLTALADLGCDVAQGHHLGRALPIAAFDRWRAERTFSVPGPGCTTSQASSVSARSGSESR